MPLTRKAQSVTLASPPPIPNGQGKKTMKMTEPERTVIMDAGVFDYLWRVVEDRYQHAPAHHPEYADLLERAVGCFRRAAAPDPEGTLEELLATRKTGIPAQIVGGKIKVPRDSGPRRVIKRR